MNTQRDNAPAHDANLHHLALSLGETQLSYGELARLKEGDVVLSGRRAGEACFVTVDGLPLARAEVAIMGERGSMLARIIKQGGVQSFGYELGFLNQLGDTLPLRISIGRVTIDEASIVKLGPGSFVNLDVSCDTPNYACLMWGHTVLAEGVAVVWEEVFGLKISKMRWRSEQVVAPVSTGNLASLSQKNACKIFDWRRPDEWTRRQIQSLARIHELFVQNLELADQTNSHAIFGLPWHELEVFVDQLNLGEADEQCRAQKQLHALTLAHNPALLRRRLEQELTPSLAWYEAADCQASLKLEFEEYRRFMSEFERVRNSADELVFVFASPFLQPALVEAENAQSFTQCLGNAWKRVGDFPLKLAKTAHTAAERGRAGTDAEAGPDAAGAGAASISSTGPDTAGAGIGSTGSAAAGAAGVGADSVLLASLPQYEMVIIIQVLHHKQPVFSLVYPSRTLEASIHLLQA